MGALDKIIVNFNYYSGSQALKELIRAVGIEAIEDFINNYADNDEEYVFNMDTFESEPE